MNVTELINLGKRKEAITLCRQQAVVSLTMAADIYLSRSFYNEAIDLLKLAVQIEPENQSLYTNLGGLLCEKHRLEEGLNFMEKGLLLPDPSADLYYNYGQGLKRARRLEEAAINLKKARDLNPNCPVTHCELGSVLMALRQFEEGMQELNWRFQTLPALKKRRRRYDLPDWKGQRNQTVLVFNEQGIGDGIMYSRYLAKFKEYNCRVVLEIDKKLEKVMAASGLADKVVAGDEKEMHPDFSYCDSVISLTSLPTIFDPRLDNIPLADSYLKSEPREIDFPSTDKLKVGIVWAGNPYHENDRVRSCFLKEFLPLMEFCDIQLFSLQQGEMVRSWARENESVFDPNADLDVVNLAECSEGVQFIDLSKQMEDYNDTANVLQKLDLLISVDTSIAHLAGALGIPVWLMLPLAHDWRWSLKWYPKMQIFQQTQHGDWAGVVERIHGRILLTFGKK
jgi:hypothetical protein